MTMTSTTDELDDCIGFLASRRADVKLTALEILAGLSGTPDGIGALKSRLDKLLVFAMRLVPVPAAAPGASEASAGALKVLVNLSQDDSAAARMVEQRAVARVMDYIREGACPHARLMCMLLSNLTAREPGCEQLLQLGQDRLQGLNVAVLLKKFVMSGINYGMGGGADGDEDPFEHVAAVLTNLTRLEAARRLLLEDGRGLLPVLVAQLQSPSQLRRRGAAGAVKNCCMRAEGDGTLASLLRDDAVLAKMLEPISGAEKAKEPDAVVREALAESVLAIALTTEGRAALWRVKAPEMLKAGYAQEDHPGVCHAMEQAAELFIFNSEVTDGDGGAGAAGGSARDGGDSGSDAAGGSAEGSGTGAGGASGGAAQGTGGEPAAAISLEVPADATGQET
mmetsp:Transcript_21144/g.63303  ORF Transcript_21144/g.63303 Transcript_21144/m.63303 type:complete len:395 (-) Transcript_21144:598-1782(-)